MEKGRFRSGSCRWAKCEDGYAACARMRIWRGVTDGARCCPKAPAQSRFARTSVQEHDRPRTFTHIGARTLSRVVWGSTATMRTSTCHCARIPCRVGYRAVWDTVPRQLCPRALAGRCRVALGTVQELHVRSTGIVLCPPLNTQHGHDRQTCIGLPRLSCSSTSSTTPCPRTRCQTRWPSWIWPSGSGLDASDSGDSGLSDIADVRACVGVVARECARNVHARTRVRAVW